MKIAVVGCGALGSFYGARLWRAQQEVHFLLRSDYEVVRRKGVFIRSPEGDFQARPNLANTPEKIGRSDLVLIGLKTTANDQFARLLTPLVGPATAILTLQNGLGNEEQLARSFPSEQILGGLCFVCLNRLEPGVIHHIDHGRIILGEFGRGSAPRTHQIASLFREAGVPCDVTENLARSHWEKLVWNIPFNGLGVASAAGYESLLERELQSASPAEPGWTSVPPRPMHPSKAHPSEASVTPVQPLTTDQLLGDPRWATLVRELMDEVIAAANALGFDLHPSVADEHIRRTQTMGPYKASTLIDYERGQPLELEALFLEPLRLAQSAGIATPRLAALCAVLQKLNPV